MDIQLLFKLFNYGVLIPWALMILLPDWKVTLWMVRTYLPVLIIAVSYLLLTLWDVFIVQGGAVDFLSLQSIKSAFSRDIVMLIGWMHYLAFDLFVGMWEMKDARRIKLPHLLLIPCLLLTLLLGPVGFVLYWVFSKMYKK
jgi:hypothetical protein